MGGANPGNITTGSDQNNAEVIVLQDGSVGQIKGRVLDAETEIGISDVDILVNVKGKTFTASTEADGKFQMGIENIKRGEGYNIHFSHDSYRRATRAGVFTIPNLNLELGIIELSRNR